MCVCGEMTSQMEFSRFQSTVTQMHSAVTAIAREIQGNLPLMITRLYVTEMAENCPTELKIILVLYIKEHICVIENIAKSRL